MPSINFRNSHNFHLPRITIDASRNMRIFFGIRILRKLANKFALFFLPVFLFQLGEGAHFWADHGLS